MGKIDAAGRILLAGRVVMGRITSAVLWNQWFGESQEGEPRPFWGK